MSLVGPRPAIPYELAAYQTWHRRRVLEVKPGMTGLWQVNGRCRVKFDEMVRLDLRYAEIWSPWLDIRILLRTPRAVLEGQGAHKGDSRLCSHVSVVMYQQYAIRFMVSSSCHLLNRAFLHPTNS